MFSIFYFLIYLFIYLHHASSEPGQRNTPLRVGSPQTGQTMTTPCGTARGAPPCPLRPASPPRGAPRAAARGHLPALTATALERHAGGKALACSPPIRPWRRPSLGPRPPETRRADVGSFQRGRSVACSLAVWVPQPPNSAPLGRRLTVCVCHAQTSHGPAPAASPDARGA